MFCTNCGTRQEEGAVFCGSCGARLELIRQTSAQQTQQTLTQQAPAVDNFVPLPLQQQIQQTQPEQQQNPKKSKKLVVIIAVAAVVVVALALAAILYFTGFFNQKSNDQSTTSTAETASPDSSGSLGGSGSASAGSQTTVPNTTTTPTTALSDSQAQVFLEDYYRALGQYDSDIAASAVSFNTNYNAPLSTRQSEYNKHFGSSSSIHALYVSSKYYVTDYKADDFPEKYRTTKANLDRCYELLIHRAQDIDTAWQRSQEFADVSGHESYINETLQAALDSNKENKYLKEFKALYPVSNPDSMS